MNFFAAFIVIFAVAIVLGVVYFRRRLRLAAREHSEACARMESHLGSLPRLDLAQRTNRDGAESDASSFFSCFGDIDELERHLACTKPSMRAMVSPTGSFRARLPSQNNNKISQYVWLHSLLQSIVSNAAKGTVKTMDTQQIASPLFVVAGACPNAFSPMQAVLFCQVQDATACDDIDFWWVKPRASNKAQLEENTLHRQPAGPYKNTAERSRMVYAPIAERFRGQTDGDFTFGFDERGRAFIEEKERGARMMIFFIWMESWSGAMSRRKFVQGKLFYNKDSAGGSSIAGLPRFFARQYRIEDGRILIAPAEDEEIVPGVSVLPPDTFQDMFEMQM